MLGAPGQDPTSHPVCQVHQAAKDAVCNRIVATREKASCASWSC